MSWTPPTIPFVDSTVLSAADLNAYVRDNMLEMMAAKATGPLRHFVAQGANVLAEREIAHQYLEASDITTSSSFVTLGFGPSVTVTTGSSALMVWTVNAENDSVVNENTVAIAISGATTSAAGDSSALQISMKVANKPRQCAMSHLQTGLTPGSNTFTMQMKVSGGNGKFSRRTLMVVAL